MGYRRLVVLRLLLGLLLLLPSRALEVCDDASNTTWFDLEPLNTPRAGHGAALFLNKIYVVGGMGKQGILDSVEHFDLSKGIAGKWTTGVALTGGGLWFLGLVVMNDPVDGLLLYTLGGSGGSTATTRVLTYDARTFALATGISFLSQLSYLFILRMPFPFPMLCLCL